MKVGDTIDGDEVKYEVKEVWATGRLVVEPVKPEGDEERVQRLAQEVYREYEHKVHPGAEGVWEKERDHWQQVFLTLARRALQLLGAPKATISAENLEKLARWEHAFDHLTDVHKAPWREGEWEQTHSESYKEEQRRTILAMLNAEVVAPEVDFVVSGRNGECIKALTEKARCQWPDLPKHWGTLGCDQRRGNLLELYHSACRVLLDMRGGAGK